MFVRALLSTLIFLASFAASAKINANNTCPDLNEIKRVANELASKIPENQTYRVTVEKRFTNLHSDEIITAAASDIKAKVDLHKPDYILLIEVLGGFTGISLLKPSDILGVVKEKMMPT